MKLWQLLAGSLADPRDFLVALDKGGGVAVLILDRPEYVTEDEREIACAVHAAMRRGVLVVF